MDRSGRAQVSNLNMKELVKGTIKAALHLAGLEIFRINPVATTAHRRLAMMRHHGIEVAVDVGANAGQYGSALRQSGYKDAILSFEPLSGAFKVLESAASRDAKWRVYNVAIGAENGESDIHVAANTWSSSLLPILDAHVSNAPASRYISTEHVRVCTLDSALEGVIGHEKRVLLKIDTQGYEDQVIKGAISLIERQVHLIECELSLVPLYEGQCLFSEMMSLLAKNHFSPVHLEPGFSDQKTGYCLQLDGIFARLG